MRERHGGRREGAGCKPAKYPSRLIRVKCSDEEWERIKGLGTRKRALVMLDSILEDKPDNEHRRVLNADFGSYQVGLEELVNRYIRERKNERAIL